MGKVTTPRGMLLYYSLKGLHLLEKTDKETVLNDLSVYRVSFTVTRRTRCAYVQMTTRAKTATGA